MAANIVRVKLPQEDCTAELMYRVSKPVISNFNTSFNNDPSNYPFNGWVKLVVLNGKLYAFFASGYGYSIAEYNTTTSTFGAAFEIPTLTYNCQVAFSSSKIYFYSGRTKANSTVWSNVLYEFDPSTQAMRTVSTNNVGPVREYGVACVVGNKFYAFSGQNNFTSGYVVDFSECNIDTGVWTARSTTPHKRDGGSMLAVGTDLYLFGSSGIDQWANSFILWKFDTLTFTWTNVTTAATMSSGSQLFYFNGDMYLHGNEYDTHKMMKFVPGTSSFVDVSTSLFTGPYEVNVLNSVVEFGGELWYKGTMDKHYNNGPAFDAVGKLDLIAHTLTIINSRLCAGAMQVTATAFKCNPTNPPDQVRFRLIGDNLPGGQVEFTQPFLTNWESYGAGLRYDNVSLPATVVLVEDAEFIQIAYKSVLSDWSAWSDIYPTPVVEPPPS